MAYVHPDAKIGKNVTIEPFAYIEGDMGNTAAFWYDYDAHTTIVFYWYGNLSPYTTQAGSVALMYH